MEAASRVTLGFFHGIDPAAAVIIDGRIEAHIEEERLRRYKLAAGLFPIKSIEACLRLSGLKLSDVDNAVFGWDAPRYGSGDVARFCQDVNRSYPPNPATLSWQ